MVWNQKLDKLAEVVVGYSVNVARGDEVAIMGSDQAGPLVQELYRRVLVAGGHPTVISRPADLEYLFYRYASEEQIDHVPPVFEFVTEKYDAVIRLRADHNLRALTNIDSEKIARRQKATEEIMAKFMQRAAEGGLSWTLAQFPTHACAQEAEMALTEYREFFTAACKLDCEDPIAEWKDMEQRQDEIIDYLNEVEDIHITARDTDVRMSTAGRTWINCCGHRNYPDGEVFTGPIEDSVNGHVRFSFPGIYSGQEIEDIRLTFEEGKVVDAEAAKGKKLLDDLLESDEGARRLGELGIGTNDGIQRFTRNMLFDEKMGGTVHLALGRGYPKSGSRNESGIHWDILCDMQECGKIYADGKLVYENGKFTI